MVDEIISQKVYDRANEVIETAKKLSTKDRNSLPKSSFCG
jgi:hypothetical protein